MRFSLPHGRLSRRHPCKAMAAAALFFVGTAVVCGSAGGEAQAAALGRALPTPTGDILATWMELVAQESGLGAALRRDEDMVSALLLDPASPYSLPRVPASEIFAGRAWRRALELMAERGTPFTDSQARRAIAWDLGLTHALPGLDPAGEPVELAGGALVQGHLIKSGVSVDLFQQAIRLLGTEHYAIAAYYATAAMALRHRLAALPAERRAGAGVREGVLLRFLLADHVGDLSGSDWLYLSRLLASERDSWRVGRVTVYGQRSLPASLSVARVAAAYRQAIGYTGTAPCRASGLVDPAAGGEPCLSQANDRAVHTWYRRVLAGQLASDESTHGLWQPGLESVMFAVAESNGFFDPGALTADEHAGHAEGINTVFVNDVMPVYHDAAQARALLERQRIKHVCPAVAP